MSISQWISKSHFPDPLTAQDDGLLCFGGELSEEVLLDAYYHGIFPWPQEGYPLLWFCPKERGILEFKDLHISKSLRKNSKKKESKFLFNQDFDEIIEYCAQVPRKGQKGTWITQDMKEAYKNLFKKGHVLSVGCYREDKLVGGLYGVFLAGVFSGESMFGIEDDVSKLCVIEMVNYLETQGLDWMDIQMVTPVLEKLGGKYILREEYLQKLEKSHRIFFKNR